MFGSDAFYFLCLSVSVVAAIAVPIAFHSATVCSAFSGSTALVCCFGIVIGFACSLPFRRTIEMPWYPYLAGVYFGGLALFMLFRSAQIAAMKTGRDARRP